MQWVLRGAIHMPNDDQVLLRTSCTCILPCSNPIDVNLARNSMASMTSSPMDGDIVEDDHQL